jgi:hypothetical protein
MNAPLHRELPATVLDSARALDQVSRQWDEALGRLKRFVEEGPAR